MKASRFLRFYWTAFLLFSIGFFQTNYASIFENGRWGWEDAPGFDTSVVKAGYIPIKYYVFGSGVSQGNYYFIEFVACLSVIAFICYFIGFCSRLFFKKTVLSGQTTV